MNHEQVIKQLIADRFNISLGTVTNEARLVKDLKADSLDTVELIMDIEGILGVKIGDEYLGEISTVQHIIDIAIKLDHEKATRAVA